jgi:uncharacterized delta-60 repeat protein
MIHRSPLARAALRTGAAVTALVASCVVLLAVPGALDPTFDHDGLVVGHPGSPHGLAIQPDGRIVVAAQYGSTLTRFEPDGSPDPTFVGRGRNDGYGVEAVVLDPSGRILAAGTIGVSGGTDFLVARYLPDGTPDAAFGSGGRAHVDVSGASDWAFDLALDGAGRILVAGTTLTEDTAFDFAVARLTPDGRLDTTFGGDGIVTADFTGGIDTAVGVAVDRHGRIVAAGTAGGAAENFAAVRYTDDGVPDPTFGDHGNAIADFATTREIAEAMVLDRDDGVIVAGRSESPSVLSDFALTRIDASGRLDEAFGTSGMALTDFFGMDDVAQALALDQSGRLVAFGRAQTSPGYSEAGFALAVARYTRDGTLDTALGAGGTVTTSLAHPMAWWGSVAIDAVGRIVVAGTVDHAFVLARYLADDSPEPVAIDIRPGDPRNTISLARHARVEVAVLSTPGFLAPAEVEAGSLAFGLRGDEPSLLAGKGGAVCKPFDADGDGIADLCCLFVVASTGLDPGDTTACLTGRTRDGRRVEGRGSVAVSP